MRADAKKNVALVAGRGFNQFADVYCALRSFRLVDKSNLSSTNGRTEGEHQQKLKLMNYSGIPYPTTNLLSTHF
jgi:hypothetical protein